jgi:methyl acetate hydrolase
MPNLAGLDKILESAVAGGRIPGVSATVVTRDGVVYEGAAGVRGLENPAAMTPDTVFWIASMTKALTATAAMLLVERGKLDLDAPASRLVAELGEVKVLEGFDATGKPRLRLPRHDVTLRNLLTHTSGHAYEFLNPMLAQFHRVAGLPSVLTCRNAPLMAPLMSDPGQRWEYGIGIDWAGKMVEAASGQKLSVFLQEHLFGPLGMSSTSFKLAASQRSRLASVHARAPDGTLSLYPFEVPQEPEFEMGGGGVYSTVQDYSRFCRMILQDGLFEGRRILAEKTVAEMARPQLGDLDAGRIPVDDPALFNDTDFFPGMRSNWGLSFLINPQRSAEGRSAGSLAWAGVANSFYWIDREQGVASVIAMQILPFFDAAAVKLLRAFEASIHGITHPAQ